MKESFKQKLKRWVNSTEFTVVCGLVIVPFISFIFIMTSPESPLYTSISRMTWIHGGWFVTLGWAVVVMGVIIQLTYKMVKIGPLTEKSKKIFLIYQILNILLVFIGCLFFPAKADSESAVLINHLHDYLTTGAWALYGVGLIAYSIMIGRKNKFLGFIGRAIMTFIVCSSVFFISNVIDPTSYVGASAVSEVYIINSLLIYLVVIYVLEQMTSKQTAPDEASDASVHQSCT